MRLNVKKISSTGSSRMTSQSEYHISGEIDGDSVEFTYVDSGNNAEHDEELIIDTNRYGKYEEAIWSFIENGEPAIFDLKAGDSVVLDKELEKQRLEKLEAQRLEKEKAKIISEVSAKTKRKIPYKGPVNFKLSLK